MGYSFEYVQQRYREFWNRENEDRPIFNMHAPKNIVLPEIKAPQTLAERWLDAEYQIKNFRRGVEMTEYLAESFPLFNPNLGPDILGAVCGGCELEFGEVTSWAEEHKLTDYESFPKIEFNENNKWWKKIAEITEAAVEDAKGDYLVGITDLHPGADAIVSMRGAEEAALDLYLEPENFKQRVWEVFDIFKEMTARLNAIISAKQQGSANWMSILQPDKLWYVTSCDFAYMISQEHFEEFIVPELLAELDWLEASIFHLDGVGSLKHLDRLLEMEKLGGVQWVYGDGKPTAKHWIDVYKKIQAAGKCVEIPCRFDDIIPVCEALDPRGVRFCCDAPDIESGKEMIKEVERICRQKRGVFALK